MTFELDPDCGRLLPGIQLRFVTALGLRGTAPRPDTAAVFDLDKIAGTVVVHFENGRVVYRGAEYATCTENSTNIVCVIERTDSGRCVKAAQRDLVEALRHHADAVIASVIEPETPRTDLRPDEPAFVV